MKTPLCTLFGFNYLDKGLVLYESLERVASDFVLYVLAMDEECFDFLLKQEYKYLIPIRLSDFENKELLTAKGNRSFGEYCWTCSSSLIKYVLDRYKEPACAYIDADMCFYSDPVVLFEELLEHRGSVLLTGHRFCWFERDEEKKVGHFCVEFNLFLNDESANKVLDIWISQSLSNSSATSESWGDQKYLDGWTEEYPFVKETRHLGAGVAPWNISQYKLQKKSEAGLLIKAAHHDYPLVFYHFQGIKYLERDTVDIGLYNYWGIDDDLVSALYNAYLEALERAKRLIQDQTGKEVLIKSHPALVHTKRSFIERFRSAFSKLFHPSYWPHILFIDLPKSLFRSKNLIRIQV